MSFFLMFHCILQCSQVTKLWSLQVDSKGTQSYIYTCSFSPGVIWLVLKCRKLSTCSLRQDYSCFLAQARWPVPFETRKENGDLVFNYNPPVWDLRSFTDTWHLGSTPRSVKFSILISDYGLSTIQYKEWENLPWFNYPTIAWILSRDPQPLRFNAWWSEVELMW